ncbi:MAG: hypothetical protein Q9174_005240, partial [Haloplaca sp. 1 TL-2023]
MAPQIVEAAAGSAAKEFKKESAAARLLGSGGYDCEEIDEQPRKSGFQSFHFQKQVFDHWRQITSASNLNQVIFRKEADAALSRKLTSLFPGLGYAAGYKILQRIYKYGGQPFVRDYLALHHGDKFDRTFGKGTGKAIMSATAGSIIGIGEIVLLPLDVLKIKRQTNPEAFRGRGVVRIVADEGMGLYRGAGWTAARNAPGSFALFGGSAFAKEYLYKLTDYNTATWVQNGVASVAGASASLIVSAPLDVIKTRIQNRNFESPESGFKIVGKMVKNEGFTSFFKGLTPKLLMTGPKLVFSFWFEDSISQAVLCPTNTVLACKSSNVASTNHEAATTYIPLVSPRNCMVQHKLSTMAPNIPGFTFDEAKGKYFKIISNHHATSAGSYTIATVTKNQESSLHLQQEADHKTRVDKELIKRSSAIQWSSASTGLMGHDRERGAYDSQMGDVWRQAWADGLERIPFVQRLMPLGEAQNARDIRRFVLDEVSGSVIFVLNHHSPPNQQWGSSLQATTHGAEERPAIHVQRVWDAEDIDGSNQSGTSNLLSPPIYNHAGGQLFDKLNEISDAVAGPHTDKAVFAVATSHGVMKVEVADRSLSADVQDNEWAGKKVAGKTNCVDFWGHDQILGGTLNGKIRLWDTRSKGSGVQFQHPSCVINVRSLDDNRVVATGTRCEMHIYDKRYIKAIPQKEQYDLFEHSRSVVTFPTFRRRNWVYPHIGFDVHKDFNIAAAGTEDRDVQIFDLKSGREFRHHALD